MGNQCLLLLLLGVVFAYLFSCLCTGSRPDGPQSGYYGSDDEPLEGFEREGPDPPDDPPAGVAPPTGVQALIDLSDVLTGAEQRDAVRRAEENAEQIQSVNDRFNAAKRRVVEHKLRPGTVNNKERRKIVEALLRRPHCARRVRSWRTENSDTLRGDVIPKSTSSWGMMKAGRTNPAIDLHPGAMGLMSGLRGQWLSEENIPDNVIEDATEIAA
jgi:hypothetical protein